MEANLRFTSQDELDFSRIFYAIPLPSLILSSDLRIVSVNQAYLEATKTTSEEILGRGLFEVFPDNPRDPAANGLANLHASLKRVLGEKSADTMAIQKYDIQMTGANGVYFEERYWRPVNTPVFDLHGDVSHIIHCVEDVTEAVKAQNHSVNMASRIDEQAQQIVDQRYITDLFQQAPVFMAMLTGPEHRVESVNSGYLTLIGHRDIIGKTVAEGLPDAAAQGYVELLDQVYRSGEAYAANGAKYAVQATPGGATNDRYVDFVFQPIRDTRGALTGILVQGVDVTERMLTEVRRNALVRFTDTVRELKTPEEIFFQASVILGETLDVSRVGYGTIDPVAETLTVTRDWNAVGVGSLAGTLSLRDYGSFIDDLKLGKFISINDVERDPRTSSAAAALQARSAASFVNVPVKENGQLVAVVFINHAATREWSPEDLALIKEIAERTRTASERLRNEIAVQLSEAKFRSITDVMPQMVWSALPDGCHDYDNRQWQRFTGTKRSQGSDSDWESRLHPDDRDEALARWQHSLASGEDYDAQFRLKHVSGEYRWVLGRATAIWDDAGQVTRWMGTFTDIHTQKLAEDEWRRESERKDEFLAMLAHELRNPMAPISTAAQLLKLPGADAKRIAHAGDIIARQVRHMTTIVDDLLDVSRVTRGLVEIEQASLDLKAAINGAVEQVQPLIQARRHELLLRITPDRAMVRGDRTRLVQAVSNLLNNAVKYTPPGGRIALSLDVVDGLARISISDNGIGMTAQLLPRVFDLFIQAERTPDRSQGGLGLGLALVKSIAGLHAGSVQAESEGIGKGSMFTITLPLLVTQDETPASAPTLVSKAAGKGLRVLIVDDNQDAGAMLGYMLETVGHEVVVVEDAASALGVAQHGLTEVFILDLGLPDIDGYELARRLRADPCTAGASIIALTGYGQPQDLILSSAAGFDHHFVKPADHRELLRVLSELAAN